MKNHKFSHYASAFLALALLATPTLLRAGGSGNLSDSDIERDVKKNMPSAISGRVTVTSQDGIVTLTGSVISDSQKSWAESAARQVPQVRKVDDQLRVENDSTAYGSPRSDKWIAFKIKTELTLHKNVSATHTDVTVVNGMVTLSGTADNSAQRELTEEYAKRVDGVRGVRNEIQIRDANTTFAGDDMNGRTMGDKVDDSAITAKVKAQLAGHNSTSAIRTHVRTENGIVYITGEAKNDAEKDLVTKIAKDTDGVNSVQNDMTVDSP